MNKEEQIDLIVAEIKRLWRERIRLLDEIEHLEKLLDKIKEGDIE